MRSVFSAILLLAAAPFVFAQTSPATAPAQQPAPQAAQPSAPTAALPAAAPAGDGGTIHGAIRAGAVPLPGVSVTATSTLTGKKYSTTTDAGGHYALTIPQRGRYVVRTELAAFADVTKEALLNAASHDQAVDFELVLASRAAQQEQQPTQRAGARQYQGRGQNLNLMNAASDLIQAGMGGGESGAELPSLAGNTDFSGDSVAVAGQNGTTSPLAGIDFSQMRDNAELNQSLNGGQGGPGGQGGQGGPGGAGGPGGGGFGGGGFAGGGGGGRGGRGGGGGGGGRGNFRNFKPNQPHGAFFWTGGNGALNAEDFALSGQPLTQPDYASNQFGLTFIGVPYIPKILTKDNKDFIFFTLSGQRSSTPFDSYGTVPTADERAGNFSSLKDQNGNIIPVYAPSGESANLPAGCAITPGQQFPGNVIPSGCISSQATALLNYVPLPTPSLAATTKNYQLLSSQESNLTRVGIRFIRNFGGGGGSPIVGMIRQALGQGGNTLHQNISANYNYSHTAQDNLDLFPQLGGKQMSNQYSLQLGYTIGKGKVTNNLGLNWNRSHTQATNYFTNTTDVASQIGLENLPDNPLLYGLPSVTLSQFTGLTEQQPNFTTNQTLSFTEGTSWIHAKHNMRFGGDIRRVHDDMLGNTGNATGTYIFTGLFTQAPGTSDTSAEPSSGSALADLLLGLPQSTTLQAPDQESYLRENVYDLYAQDDWRALPGLSLLFGLRYDYYSPYSEKYDHLATIDVSSDFFSVAPTPILPNGVGQYGGKYPRDLIYPERNNFSPRLGFAWSPHRGTVIRGGYGINYTVGQYAKFVQDFAFQPPFANVQTNEATTGADITLQNGFTAQPPGIGNYAVNKNYRLPYIQLWNLNVQQSVPWGIVMNFGYSGSKGTRLDIVDAPGRLNNVSVSGVLYDYEDSVAFSNFNTFVFSARKRLSHGLSLQATYAYAHSIDNSTSIGGNGGSISGGIVQNWQNLLAEESNSSFDVRNKVSGSFLYELPFGPDAHLLNTGWVAKTLENLSLSGTYSIASGMPLTPSYAAAADEVARGSSGSERPDRVYSQSITAGGGSLNNWFNKDAFTTPAGEYGTASRYSIPGPATISVNASASKTIRLNETRTFEIRATANNVFNIVQYAGVNTTVDSASYGQVTGAGSMRQFTFLARFRY